MNDLYRRFKIPTPETFIAQNYGNLSSIIIAKRDKLLVASVLAQISSQLVEKKRIIMDDEDAGYNTGLSEATMLINELLSDPILK